jgi:hypothetical protein
MHTRQLKELPQVILVVSHDGLGLGLPGREVKLGMSRGWGQ